jgi:DNA (cytosine-5)-methyltransferase 1
VIYGSVCSGIEAASVAWHPLGWRAAFLSEIEAFPRAVLAHHYPDVPLHGDFTTIQAGAYDAIDLLVGGTPCQSFSVAGLRGGLDDERGNLALQFLKLAQRLRPRWVVWENVPGVLSSNGGRDFGSILGGLAELGYGWAYRVLDAQYFGLAQRRRRVFVVGCLGDWRRAAAVLFERHSLSGHPAPRREAGQGVAAGTAPSLTGSGRGVPRPGESRGQDPVIPVAFGGNNTSGPIGVATDVATHRRFDFETETLLTHALRGVEPDASEDGTGRGTPLVPVEQPYTLAIRGRDGVPTLEASQDGVANAILTPNGGRAGIGVGAVAIPILEPGKRTGASTDDPRAGMGVGEPGDPMYTLQSGAQHGVAIPFDTTQITSKANYSTPRAGDPCHPLAAGAHPPAIAFSCKDHGADAGDVAPTLCGMGHDESHPNGGGQVAVAFHQTQDPISDPERRTALGVTTMGMGVMHSASAYEADASSLLSTLRERLGAEAVAEWGSRVLDPLQSPEVLRAWLHGESIRCASDTFRRWVDDRPLPREEGVPARAMREVWENGPDGRTSQGRGLAKQLAWELGEALSKLPYKGPLPAVVVQRMRPAAERARLLREALSAVQEVGRSTGGEGQPAYPAMAVRRLTPVECERLMGLPDNYTLIPYRGKPAADGPRYKALGNSMAVPVMRWIGERIQMVEALTQDEEKAA